MITRQHIRQFLAVADAGSFSRAAVNIGVTQPTLSAGIAELERRLGSPLFIRDRRAIRLTPAGSRMLASARLIDREFRSVESTRSAAAQNFKVLTLGVINSLSTQMLSQIVRGFKSKHELAIIEGTSGDLAERMKRGKIDVAITLLEQDLVQTNCIPIYKEGYRIMLPSNHKLAKRISLDVHELAEETMIARRSCEILGETSRFFTQRGIRPLFGLRSTNDDRCMEMVKAGLGVTTAPLSFAREGVSAVEIAGYNFERCIGLKFSNSMDMSSESARALIDLCRDISGRSSKGG